MFEVLGRVFFSAPNNKSIRAKYLQSMEIVREKKVPTNFSEAFTCPSLNELAKRTKCPRGFKHSKFSGECDRFIDLFHLNNEHN